MNSDIVLIKILDNRDILTITPETKNIKYTIDDQPKYFKILVEPVQLLVSN